jgi:hypothetical protein
MLKNVDVRRATITDVDAIADAHLDSIRSIGPRYYSADVVAEWGSSVTGRMYIDAMSSGEVFFIALGSSGEPPALGFSTHRVDEGEHRTAVYVRRWLSVISDSRSRRDRLGCDEHSRGRLTRRG